MITLGINAAYHDCAACLVRDGAVVAAAEEERFTHVKHGKRPVPFTVWQLPYHAIDYCLREAGAMLCDVDHVAYSFEPRLLPGIRRGDASIALPLEPSARGPASDQISPWDPLFACYVINAPRQLAGGAPHHLRERFQDARHDGPFRWHYVEHHLAHEASAFLASPFDAGAVLTMDGHGERATTSYGMFVNGDYKRLRQINRPHSLAARSSAFGLSPPPATQARRSAQRCGSIGANAAAPRHAGAWIMRFSDPATATRKSRNSCAGRACRSAAWTTSPKKRPRFWPK